MARITLSLSLLSYLLYYRPTVDADFVIAQTILITVLKIKNTAGILLAEFRKAAEMPLFINWLTEYRPF